MKLANVLSRNAGLLLLASVVSSTSALGQVEEGFILRRLDGYRHTEETVFVDWGVSVEDTARKLGLDLHIVEEPVESAESGYLACEKCVNNPYCNNSLTCSVRDWSLDFGRRVLTMRPQLYYCGQPQILCQYSGFYYSDKFFLISDILREDLGDPDGSRNNFIGNECGNGIHADSSWWSEARVSFSRILEGTDRNADCEEREFRFRLTVESPKYQEVEALTDDDPKPPWRGN